ncbi:MAG: Maf family protein [Saccharofermentans sp.]|nr:Maf family protein [Saccharofermentans sp.]
MKIILASKSPRRQELLRLITSDFEIKTKEIDERAIEDEIVANGGSAKDVQLKLAKAKAQAVWEELTLNEQKEYAVIGSDTSVISGNAILGKPVDKDDARRMLTSLCGKEHEVISSVCVISQDKTIAWTEVTKVRFGELDKYQEDLIERYINTDEPYDKAGAYGIQEGGALLVESVSGDYFNVVGLPVRKLSIILNQLL